ncbi:MAG: protein kinase domain-containing protein [Prochlorothrix sp.]
MLPGQGGFGATFLAKNKGLPGDPQCVIKQLRPSGNAPNVLEMARDLFAREAKTLGKIGSHPQIPTLLDYFEERKEFYLVQEFVSGLTLQQEVRQNGPFTEAGAKQFLSEILPLIQYIHSQQVIHRDIKPANIVRRNQDRKLVLIDFGAVKDQVNPVAANASEQTALTSYAIGTPGYAPPEQMAMRPVYSSDIYALGVTCLFLLSGKAPKDFSYDPRTGEMQWRKELDISDHFAKVLAKMLDASVKHRYQMANDVLQALDMEPYLDSLAQSLIKPASSNGEKTSVKPDGRRSRWGSGTASPQSGTSGDTSQSTSSSSRSRQVADIAERIRQRRQTGRGGANRGGTGMAGRTDSTQVFGAPRGRGTSGGGASSGGRGLRGESRPAAERLSRTRSTADQVLNSYGKGIRDFAFHELSNLDLSKSVLIDGNFHDSRFFKTNLQGADLTNATLSKANFNQSNLRDAILVRAYMNYTNLQNADLRGADLSYAHLSNANLKGANLSGANLTGAKITDTQLAQAKTSWNTTMPNGKANWRQ